MKKPIFPTLWKYRLKYKIDTKLTFINFPFFKISCVHMIYQYFSHLRFEYDLPCKTEEQRVSKYDRSNCRTDMTVCFKYFKSWVRYYTLVRTFYDTEENILTGNNTCFFAFSTIQQSRPIKKINRTSKMDY